MMMTLVTGINTNNNTNIRAKTNDFLQKYAEIGYTYVVKVKEMIKKNKLNKFENSKLIVY